MFNSIIKDHFLYTLTVVDNILDMEVGYYPDVNDCPDG